MNTIIESENIDKNKIFRIFESAFKKPEYNNDEILVKGDRYGFNYLLELNTDAHTITFRIIFQKNETLNYQDALKVLNEMNYSYIFGKFSIIENSILFLFSLDYSEGITPLQLLSTFKRFDSIVSDSIQEYKITNINI